MNSSLSAVLVQHNWWSHFIEFYTNILVSKTTREFNLCNTNYLNWYPVLVIYAVRISQPLWDWQWHVYECEREDMLLTSNVRELLYYFLWYDLEHNGCRLLGFWCLTPMSTVLQLYRGGGNSIKRFGVKLVLWSQTIIILMKKCVFFPF